MLDSFKTSEKSMNDLCEYDFTKVSMIVELSANMQLSNRKVMFGGDKFLSQPDRF